MKFRPLLLALAAAVLTVSATRAQSRDCPTVPEGLSAVSSLEWEVEGESIRVRLAEKIYDSTSRSFLDWNEYLQINLIWDLDTGELQPVANERAVEALRLVEQLGIAENFYTVMDRSHLSLSTFPGSEYALYVDYMPSTTFYSVNIRTLEINELGRIGDDSPDISDVLWYAPDAAIMIIYPGYAPGTESYDICMDGSCFIFLDTYLEWWSEHPGLSNSNDRVALPVRSDPPLLAVIDLESKALVQEYTFEYLPYSAYPIWSEDDETIYFWAFDETRMDINIYQVNVATGNTEAIIEIDEPGEVSDWLFMPEERIVFWTDNSGLRIQCY